MAASRDKETPGVLKPHEATVHQCESSRRAIAVGAKEHETMF